MHVESIDETGEKEKYTVRVFSEIEPLFHFILCAETGALKKSAITKR
jgi:hypothetical protein